MNRTAHDDETASADTMAQNVAKQNEVYVRRKCRKCAIVTGGFTTSNLSENAPAARSFVAASSSAVATWRKSGGGRSKWRL